MLTQKANGKNLGGLRPLSRRHASRVYNFLDGDLQHIWASALGDRAWRCLDGCHSFSRCRNGFSAGGDGGGRAGSSYRAAQGLMDRVNLLPLRNKFLSITTAREVLRRAVMRDEVVLPIRLFSQQHWDYLNH